MAESAMHAARTGKASSKVSNTAGKVTGKASLITGLLPAGNPAAGLPAAGLPAARSPDVPGGYRLVPLLRQRPAAFSRRSGKSPA